MENSTRTLYEVALDLMQNRVKIPDKDSHYVADYLIHTLGFALQAFEKEHSLIIQNKIPR
jgi:hypothetical protein